MTPKQFQLYVRRDKGCVHCGELEAIAPNHRINRGMGGSKKRDHPANIVVLCSMMNNLIESNAYWRRQALIYGWKLTPYDDPHLTPVFSVLERTWWLLRDDFSRLAVSRWDDATF